ncbi:hypothetical protein Acy02nite_92370 [Actinoplanes cyaneus]|uniref:Uncharacterized protein n=1 Tax=Actinoplanes cyaneus TaxID=52696 RepID=A0A919IU80_9ACTN|nr:hypothetical protein Acy02nite_92370 [Actinoplanes cyaneus]
MLPASVFRGNSDDLTDSVHADSSHGMTPGKTMRSRAGSHQGGENSRRGVATRPGRADHAVTFSGVLVHRERVSH